MNKYLKILMLSGAVMGAVSPIAFKVGPEASKDINNLYENVEKIQNILPRLSRINYKLDISASTDDNVKFISTDDNGTETDLSQEETIAYLDITLQQTNIEYEQLKATLSRAIKDTMDYLDEYKHGEAELTNEQKLYIKEHSNTIKYLAETLEDLSEDVICAIDGCEDCKDCDFDEMAGKYLSAINDLETRVQALQSSLNSLQLINGISNPYFYAGYSYTPNHIVYGLRYSKPKDETDTQANNNQTIDDNTQNEQESDVLNNAQGTTSPNETETEDSQVQEVEKDAAAVNQEDNTKENTEESKPTTFGLKSNIDTYAPTRRNIDTFFNTALYNKEYGYGGGYNMPYGYGYGGGYGYGMPYGMGYGNPYGMSGYNSNLINREVLKKGANNTQVNATLNTSTDSEVETEQTTTPKKVRAKRAKNIDTYTGVTVQSNINTMGESKISNFLKEKFYNVRNKIRKQKDEIKTQDLQDKIQDKITDDIVVEETSKNVDTYKQETNIVVDRQDSNTENSNTVNPENVPDLEQESPISAQ